MILRKNLDGWIWRWGPPILYAILIFFLSSRPVPQPVQEIELPFIDKLAHLVEYLIFGFLLARTLSPNPNNRYVFILIGLIGLGYGITDELHQWFLPYRDAEVLDVLFDGIGSGIGGVVFCKLRRRHGRD